MTVASGQRSLMGVGRIAKKKGLMMNLLSLIAPIMIGSLIIYSLIARWYVLPKLRTLSFVDAFTPLLLLHSARYIGLMFLSTDVARTGMPQAFAQPAAYGDLFTAALAAVALIAVRMKSKSATMLILLFNVVGTVDLLYAVTVGVLNRATAYMGAAYWIPAVIVPVLLVSHVLVFQLLFKPKGSVEA